MKKLLISLFLLCGMVEVPMHAIEASKISQEAQIQALLKSAVKKIVAWSVCVGVSAYMYYSDISDYFACMGMLIGSMYIAGRISGTLSACRIYNKDFELKDIIKAIKSSQLPLEE